MPRSRFEETARRMAADEAAWSADVWAVVEECSAILQELEPRQRKSISDGLVNELYLRQGGACALCGKPLNLSDHHVDHRIPFTWGGGNERGNLQLAHPRCNQSKGDAVEFHDLVPYLEDRARNL